MVQCFVVVVFGEIVCGCLFLSVVCLFNSGWGSLFGVVLVFLFSFGVEICVIIFFYRLFICWYVFFHGSFFSYCGFLFVVVCFESGTLSVFVVTLGLSLFQICSFVLFRSKEPAFFRYCLYSGTISFPFFVNISSFIIRFHALFVHCIL